MEDKIKFSCHCYRNKNNEKKYKFPFKTWKNLKESVIKDTDTFPHIGIQTGEFNNITVIDFDKLKPNENKKDGIKIYEEWKDKLNTFIEESFSGGGYHAYFQYDKDFVKTVKNNGYSIDILNNNCFVLTGVPINNKSINIIPDDFKKFLMTPNISNDILINDEILENNTHKLVEDINIEYEDLDKIKDLVKILTITESDDYTSWLKIGMAIKNILKDKDEAEDIYKSFSKLSNKYNLNKFKEHWKDIPNVNDCKLGTILYYTKQYKTKMKIWNKKYNNNTNNIIINQIDKLNKFDLNDNYCFCDFKDYIFENIFKKISDAIKYLESNLYKVCVRVNDYMITKQPMDDFNNIHSIELLNKSWRSENKVKYWGINNLSGEPEIKMYSLKDFLESYPHLIHSFKKINTEFITKGQILNQNEFYITEQFKASYIENPNITKIQPLLDMILIVYCHGNQDLYNMLLMLFSFWVCNPNEKSGKCLILAGKQGTGKSTIIDFFMKFIFGNKICMFLKGFKELLADKNGHLSGKKFVNLNEVRSKKGDYFTNYDDLKTLISDEIIQIRGLYKETKNEKSGMELVITTNNPNCCPIEENDRKYIVLKVNEIYLQKDKEYWGPFRNQIFNQECGDIFYSYLLNMNVKPMDWRSLDFNSLSTELREDLKELNKNSVELFIDDFKNTIQSLTYDEKLKLSFIDNEEITYKNKNNDIVRYDLYIHLNQIRIKPLSLYNGYISYCSQNGEISTSNKYFGFDLKQKYNIEKGKSKGGFYYIFEF